MTEDQSTSGAPMQAGGEDSGKDTVAYATYQKAVSEAKKAKAELARLEALKNEEAQAALAEQGKYKDIAEKLQKELKEKDEVLKKKESYFVQSNLKNTVKSVAKELGAIDGAAEQIFAVAKSEGLLNSLELKDDYSVNVDQVKNALGELSKKSPWFFQKTPAGVKDVVMGGKTTTTADDFKAMSKDKLLEAYKNIIK